MPTLNLGIVAHVDAGKTTLTERLLFETGVSDHIGRVDHGDTITDTDALERQRGITIRSAVVTFTLGDTKVNLIDTPGHSDFVAEVERALAVLDGAVLVMSAVEGVQAQTRVLIRILERLKIPFLVFVNKIDRVGAADMATVESLRAAVHGEVLPLNEVERIGTRAAAVGPRRGSGFVDEVVQRLAEHDDEMLRRYVEGGRAATSTEIDETLTVQTSRGHLHPVYFGSALMGIGVSALLDGLRRYLPAKLSDPEEPLHASVFKIERGRAGHKIAYVRLHTGTLTPRDSLAYFRRSRTGSVVEHSGRATGVSSFAHGTTTVTGAARAGDIAKVIGLHYIEIGDQLGRWDAAKGGRHFPSPGLESVVCAHNPAERPALFEALRVLAEQDPLIDARIDGIDDEVTVSLYGEVQKEVLSARLAGEFGVETEFSDTRTVYVERVSGIGEAVELVSSHNASVGLRIEPGEIGSGFGYRLATERGYLLPSFHTAIEETLPTELEAGLLGWRVIDCVVTLIHGRFSAPTPPAGYFRQLTALALRKALSEAGTTVCEPFSEFEVEVPLASLNQVLHRLMVAGATPAPPEASVTRGRITGMVPTAEVHGFEQRLPVLTQGEGFLVTRPAGYQPVHGPPPTRTRRAAHPASTAG